MSGLQPFPFTLTKQERQTLRDCIKVVLSGGNPAADDELKEDWLKWSFFSEIAFFSLDARYGNWLFCPIGESPADLGIKTYEALETIRGLYREKINAEQKEALSRIH